MGVIIDTPKIRMEIKFVSVESLFTHEETIPLALQQLKQELIEEGILKHPIIVDTETNVVLDGMHRVAALKSLECQIAPVCLVEYNNPAIELFAWFREFSGNSSFTQLLEKICTEEKYDRYELPSSQAYEEIKTRNAMAALAYGESAFILKPDTKLTIKEIYDRIAKIEIIAQNLHFSIIYSTEKDAIQSLNSTTRPVLIVPSLTKEEVVESALKKQLFTQKTTRHVVPARPLFTNVPISWLKNSNLEEANQQLDSHLNSKRIIKRDPGAIIDGRRYEERAYLFSNHESE